MKEELKILFIGNSFAVDTMEHVANIAMSLGAKRVKLRTLYVGGCSIRQHFHYLINNIRKYEYFANDGNGWTSTKYVTSKEAIIEDNWDYIAIQHGSNDGSRYTELHYYSLLSVLVNKVKSLANKDAKIVFNMTWVGEPNNNHPEILLHNRDTRLMYNKIADLTKCNIVTMNNIDYVSPTGTAIENARTSYVSSLNRDGYHLSLGLGRYIAGLIFIKSICNIDISNIQYVCEGMSEKDKLVAIESVNNAFINPFEVTSSKYNKE